MPVREKPQADGRSDAAHDEKFIPDDDRRQNDERQTAYGDGGAGGDAADDDLEWRIKHRRQAEQEHDHADPHDALEACQLRA